MELVSATAICFLRSSTELAFPFGKKAGAVTRKLQEGNWSA